MASERIGIEELLGEADWVRRLARYLAGDDGDDLAQEAWMAAHRSPPDAGRPPRPWLAQVLRHLASARRRNDARRARRERAFQDAAPDRSAAVDEAYERIELHRFIASEVMALAEPLRTVVILRYFEGLDGGRIAEITGAPPGTVRWRLKTALDQLRTRLDDRHRGDRRAWTAILLVGWDRHPEPPPGAAAGPTSSPLRSLRVPVASVSLALLVAAGAGWLTWGRRAERVRGPHARLAAAGGQQVRPFRSPAERALEGGLEGIVTDAAGRGVGDAIVVAERLLGDFAPGLGFSGNPSPPSESTGEDGRFRFSGLQPGRYVLTATGAGMGFARSEAIDLVPKQLRRDLVLILRTAASGLSGTVLDVGGGAVPGARVLAWLRERLPPVKFATMAGSDGRFALGLPAGQYDVQAEASGYAPRTMNVTLDLPWVIDFRLEPAARLLGRVVAAPDGAPVAGASVYAINNDPKESRSTTMVVSAADGAFQFVDLAAGSYRLWVHRDHLVAERSAAVLLAVGQEVSGVEVRLAPGRRVSGHVRGPGGAPVAGAHVQGLTLAWPTATTGPDGSFAIGGILPGEIYVAASAPGFGPARRRLDARAGDVAGVDLTLLPAIEVTGLVRDPSGRPAVNARVSAFVPVAGDRAGSSGLAAFTDEAGRFRFDRLPAGPLSLSVTHAAGATEWGPVTTAPGEKRSLEIDLAAGGRVGGTVVRSDGRPAAGAVVHAFTKVGADGLPWHLVGAAVAGPDGRYELAALHPGNVLVRATDPGADACPIFTRQPRVDQRAFALQSGEHLADVDLVVVRHDTTIGGRLLDEQSHPIAGAIVTADLRGVAAGPTSGRTVSDDDGRFVLEGLNEGRYTLSVWHPEFAAQKRDGIRAGSAGLEVRLARAGSLAGRVIGPEGFTPTTFAEYRIYARRVPSASPTEEELWRHWSGGPNERRLWNADGAFRFDQLEPGVYDLHAYLSGGLVAAAQVTLASGERKEDLRLEAAHGITLTGRVIDYLSGRPIAGAQVQGRGTSSGRVAATSDAEGRFSLDGLPAATDVEFVVLGPGPDYLKDAQHRRAPAAGTLDVGAIALYRGLYRGLEDVGGFGSGVAVHTAEGRPAIFAVYEGGPAAQAGVRPGDLVLAIDGRDVRSLGGSVVEGLLATGGRTMRLTLQFPGALTREVLLTRPAR